MIIQENIDIDGRHFVRTFSDSGRYVVRDGVEYSEAYDPAEFGRTYTEGELIPPAETDLANKTEDYDSGIPVLPIY